MPFYQKLSVVFVDIPANAGTAINYNLIKKNLALSNLSRRECRELLFNPNFERRVDFKKVPWFFITEMYPHSLDADTIFSVVRNPFDRMIPIFFNFTKFKEEYKKYRPKRNDTKYDLQEKFDGFIKEFHKWRNIHAGAGLNIIEIISRKNPSITKNMYIENSKEIKSYYYYDQAYFLNKDFQKNKTIFSMNRNRSCDIIKYEELDTIYQKYPNIFTEKLLREDFDIYKNGSEDIPRLDYKTYYNKYTKKFVQEHFEIDFYVFHYELDFNLV